MSWTLFWVMDVLIFLMILPFFKEGREKENWSYFKVYSLGIFFSVVGTVALGAFFTEWPLIGYVLASVVLALVVSPGKRSPRDWTGFPFSEKMKFLCREGLVDFFYNFAMAVSVVIAVKMYLDMEYKAPDVEFVRGVEQWMVGTAEALRVWLDPSFLKLAFISIFLIVATVLFPTLKILGPFNKAVKYSGRLVSILGIILLFSFLDIKQMEGEWVVHFKTEYQDALNRIQKNTKDNIQPLVYQDMLIKGVNDDPTGMDVKGTCRKLQDSDWFEALKDLGLNYRNQDLWDLAGQKADEVLRPPEYVGESEAKTQSWLSNTEGAEPPSLADLNNLKMEADRLDQEVVEINDSIQAGIEKGISQYALSGLPGPGQDLATLFIGAFVASCLEWGTPAIQSVVSAAQNWIVSLRDTKYWNKMYPETAPAPAEEASAPSESNGFQVPQIYHFQQPWSTSTLYTPPVFVNPGVEAQRFEFHY